MSILSKILGALFAGVILLQLYATIMNAPILNLVWTVMLCLPIALALFGRGGKFVYIVSLFASWLLASLLIVALPFEIYLDHYTAPSDNDNKIDFLTALIIGSIGLVGIAMHYCLTRLHPVASRNSVARKLNGLFVDTMRRQAMAFAGNVILIVLVLDAGWMFREVAIIYWYESVLITLFTIWTVRKQKIFKTRHACFKAANIEQGKHTFCSQHLGGYFAFYGIYLAVILMVGGLPALSDLGAIAVLAGPWLVAHYIDATEQQRALRNKPLDLKAIENDHAWRILPIHLGCMLGILAIGNDDPGLALIFILFKMIFEIAQEAAGYYKRRKQAIYGQRRRPAPLDLGGIAARMPTPLIKLGNNAK